MTAAPLREAKFRLVQSLDDALDLKRWLGERRPVLAFDTETGGLESWKQPLRLTQFGDAMGAWAVPFQDWKGLIKEVFACWDGPLVGHNAMFDLRFLEANDVKIRRDRIHDTSITAHLDDPTTRQGLKQLATRHIDLNACAGQEALKEGMDKQKWTWATVPVTFTPYWAYAALDTTLTARLFEHYAPVREQFREAYELESAVALILSDMHVRGIRIDVEYTRRKKAELDDYLERMYAWVETNYKIKPGSNQAVANRLLADGVPLEKRTEKGAWSVDSEVLESLEGKHPLADAVLRYRQVTKIRSSYFEGILRNLDGELIHCDIRPLGARTARMSIANPPFQQLPSSEEDGTGALVRDCIIPREGERIVLCDLDQIEFRLLGHFAQEPVVIQAVHDGEDLHMAAAKAMYGPGATKAQRRTTKNGTFAVLYGAGKDKLAAQQGVTVAEAEAFIAHYGRTFPGIANFVSSVETVARERMRATGTPFVVTPIGRRHPMEKHKLYTGVNYLCQGTAADLFKQAIVRMDAAGIGEYLCLPVHDEIQASVPADITEDVAHTIKECMTDHTSFAIPIDAGYKIVDRWGDAYRKKAA